MAIADLYYTIEQVAQVLGVTEPTARKQIDEYRIPVEKFGNSVAILKDDITYIKGYKILASLREITGQDAPYLCKECMNRLVGGESS